MNHHYKYDVFISHAFEDKHDFVDELKQRLQLSGIKTFYSGDNLEIGRDTGNALLDAMQQSRFAIVVISAAFMTHARYAQKELAGIEVLERERNQPILLPVWYKVSADEVRIGLKSYPDWFAVRSDTGMDNVISSLLKEMQRKLHQKLNQVSVTQTPPSPRPRFRKVHLSVIAGMLLAVAGFFCMALINQGPDDELINREVAKRIEEFDAQVFANCKVRAVAQVGFDSLKTFVGMATTNNTCDNNTYYFSNGNTSVKGHKKVNNSLGCDAATGFFDAYHMKDIDCFVDFDATQQRITYLMLNNEKVQYTIVHKESVNDRQASVTIRYENPLRCVRGYIYRSDMAGHCPYSDVYFDGMKMTEHFIFERRADTWELTGKG